MFDICARTYIQLCESVTFIYYTYTYSDPKFERLKAIALKQKKDLKSKTAKISLVCLSSLVVALTRTTLLLPPPCHREFESLIVMLKEKLNATQVKLNDRLMEQVRRFHELTLFYYLRVWTCLACICEVWDVSTSFVHIFCRPPNSNTSIHQPPTLRSAWSMYLSFVQFLFTHI